VTRKIARAAARIARGKETTLTLGNLEVRRDWGFAGDYVRAMWLMMFQDAPEDLVIGSGERALGGDVLRDCVSARWSELA
jgi:GDPmannose 4,6-dehydratase